MTARVLQRSLLNKLTRKHTTKKEPYGSFFQFQCSRHSPTLPGPDWVQVPSARNGLTAVFGKGTGVTRSEEAPRTLKPKDDRK